MGNPASYTVAGVAAAAGLAGAAAAAVITDDEDASPPELPKLVLVAQSLMARSHEPQRVMEVECDSGECTLTRGSLASLPEDEQALLRVRLPARLTKQTIGSGKMALTFLKISSHALWRVGNSRRRT